MGIDPVDVSVAVPRDRRTPVRLQLDAAVADAHQNGHLHAELTAHLIETNGGKPSIRVEGEINAVEMPLAVSEPFLRRFEPRIKLDGRCGTT